MATKTKAAAHPLTDAEMEARTGKTWEQWFGALDALGGPEKGRREMGNYLQSQPGVDAWLSPTIVVEYEAARGVVERDGRPKGYMICATKTIGAAPAAAYALWSSEAGWNRWFGGKVKLDFRDGGRYSTSGGDSGEFTKIRENKAIKFTWENREHAGATIVETTFQPKGDKCIVMVAHDRIQTRARADDLRAAWGAALDRLKAVLEG